MWGLLQSADYAHSLPLHIPGRSSGEFRCGLARPTLILVPPGEWHGVHNIGHEPAILVNMVDRAYRYEDPDHWRLPADTGEIPYRFSTPSGTTDALR
jgi:dTDP-4-dehydrorhamnose 3,5-epimerase-like enzyme